MRGLKSRQAPVRMMRTMREIDDPKLGDLPPSAKLVFVVLSEEGTLTQKQLVEETRLSGRTVRYALERLREINALEEELSFRVRVN